MRYIIMILGLIVLQAVYTYSKINNAQPVFIIFVLMAIFFIAYGLFQNKLASLYSNKFYLFTYKSITFLIYMFVISLAVSLVGMYIYSQNKPKKDHDVIIVLGAGLRGADLSYTLYQRVDTAYEYYKKHPECIIVVSGGQGRNELVTEASAMKKFLVSKGVPTEKILEENKSTSTRENFLKSKVILDKYYKNKPYSVVFITNGFHLLRSSFYCKDAKLDGEGLSAPSVAGLLPMDCFREYMALSWYVVIGFWQK